jgi:hypothetical protein
MDSESPFLYIEKEEDAYWHSPKKELLKGIVKEGWEAASSEFIRFIDDGGVLDIGDYLLLKFQGSYARISQPWDPDKVKNRESMHFKVVSDNYIYDDKELERLKDILPVKRLYETPEHVIRELRVHYGLGFETRVNDNWEEETVFTKEGIHLGPL